MPAALVAEQAAEEVQVVLKCPERAAGSAVEPQCQQNWMPGVPWQGQGQRQGQGQPLLTCCQMIQTLRLHLAC